MNTRTIQKLNILFEDNHCIVVEKPAGMPVAPDDSKDESLFDAVKTYLKQIYNKPGNVFLGLVHRLDRPVQGAVVFAKTSKGAARLSEQFRQHSITKMYYALVQGAPQKSAGTLRHTIQKKEQGTMRKAHIVQSEEGNYAELSYKVLRTNKKYSLLEIQLKTGKFHQIRAQLAEIGCPIVGDLKYGAIKTNHLEPLTIALQAHKLVFIAPTSGEQVIVECNTPPEWEQFLK